MNKQEFFKGLGLSLSEEKVTEIVAPQNKVKQVVTKKTANEANSSHKPSASDKELKGLRSRLSEMAEKQQQNSEHFMKLLGSVDITLAELKGIVEASPLVVQGRELLARLEEREDNIAKGKRSWEVERESLVCPNPECRKPVGWPTLEIKPLIKPNYFPLLIDTDIVNYKECPVCGYTEEVDE